MRDVWSLFDGAAMLSLHFGTVFAAVERLRKSASARVHETKNGRVFTLFNYYIYIHNKVGCGLKTAAPAAALLTAARAAATHQYYRLSFSSIQQSLTKSKKRLQISSTE